MAHQHAGCAGYIKHFRDGVTLTTLKSLWNGKATEPKRLNGPEYTRTLLLVTACLTIALKSNHINTIAYRCWLRRETPVMVSYFSIPQDLPTRHTFLDIPLPLKRLENKKEKDNTHQTPIKTIETIRQDATPQATTLPCQSSPLQS